MIAAERQHVAGETTDAQPGARRVPCRSREQSAVERLADRRIEIGLREDLDRPHARRVAGQMPWGKVTGMLPLGRVALAVSIVFLLGMRRRVLTGTWCQSALPTNSRDPDHQIPSPCSSPGGRGDPPSTARLYRSPLPPGEGQGEGIRCPHHNLRAKQGASAPMLVRTIALGLLLAAAPAC